MARMDAESEPASRAIGDDMSSGNRTEGAFKSRQLDSVHGSGWTMTSGGPTSKAKMNGDAVVS